MRSVLPDSGIVLEVASGTGEHVIYFARQFPSLTWQPSDASHRALRSIATWIEAEGPQNVRPAVELDAASGCWPVERCDAIVCINMLHISPWAATTGLMRGAGRSLVEGAPLFLYGPFHLGSRALEPSNRTFDLQLRSSDPAWGLRKLENVAACAQEHGLAMVAVVEMPANNLSVVFRKV